MNKILAATKRSSSSAEAVALAIELAAAQRAELIFVHVVPTLDVVASSDEDEVVAIPHDATEHDRAVLDDAAATARDHGVAATSVLLRGSTAEQIVAAADTHDVDLIVVGSRGHSAIASALLGNVSLRVLRQSSRPVLIVRGRNQPRPTPKRTRATASTQLR
jgi:nucleotide-binding universal stress UspA family protein